MRRVWLVGGGLALVLLAGSSELSATSSVGTSATSLLTNFHAGFAPGTLALAGSTILGLLGFARRRRERQKFS